MSNKDETVLRIVLYEGNDAQPLPAADRFAAMTALLERGYAVTRVAASGRVASADRSELLVLGNFNGSKMPPAEDVGGRVPVRFHDIGGSEINRVAEFVESTRTEAKAAKHGEWKPWFPVIDYDRCTNC